MWDQNSVEGGRTRAGGWRNTSQLRVDRGGQGAVRTDVSAGLNKDIRDWGNRSQCRVKRGEQEAGGTEVSAGWKEESRGLGEDKLIQGGRRRAGIPDSGLKLFFGYTFPFFNYSALRSSETPS